MRKAILSGLAILAAVCLLSGMDCGGGTRVVIWPPPPNEPPEASDQALSTVAGVPLNIVLDVTDAIGTVFATTIVSGPSHGLLNGSGRQYTYTPQAGFQGTDVFTYTASDGQLDSNTATVTITIEPPSVSFTKVPPLGSQQDLEGTTNVDPGSYKIVVYIKVNGTWWVKPRTDTPLTTINSNGTWKCDVTTGGIDEQATELRAYAVPNGWTLPGTNTLPNAGDYVAFTSATR